MPLMPKRVKHRKSQRGRIKSEATRGNRVIFGEFGLQAEQPGWLPAATIEAGRIAAQQYLRGGGDCISACFRTNQLPRFRWKPVWVKGKANLISGLRLYVRERFFLRLVV